MTLKAIRQRNKKLYFKFIKKNHGVSRDFFFMIFLTLLKIIFNKRKLKVTSLFYFLRHEYVLDGGGCAKYIAP